MDSTVKSLSEEIDNIVQQYSDKFEEYALSVRN